MPIYSYKCPTCARKRDVFKPIAELDRVEGCLNCGFAMNRQLSAPMVKGDYPGYSCPITGKWIEGRRAHEENLKKHGCRVLEAGETESAKRTWAAEDTALENAVESTVEEFVETLPTEKKERLAAEIQSGLDVELTRN
jgi:putative FmdB family regulatory protein